MGGDLQLRRASADDRETLLSMQALSMRILATPFYGDRAVEAFVAMGTMDDALLEEGRYYLAEIDGQLVGSGGWSTQMPGYAAILEAKPANDSDIKARVRSVYVHPLFVRQGIARTLMEHIEEDIVKAGFDTGYLGATLSGLPLYRRLGWHGSLPLVLQLPGNENLVGINMAKRLGAANEQRDLIPT